MMEAFEIKKIVIKIVPEILENTPVIFAYLYGSYAIDQTHPFSDLDIGIYTSPLTLRESMKLEMDLALEIDKKLKNGPSSDVRTMNSLPLAVVGNILTEGMLIYCKEDAARIDYETTMRKRYFDFLPVIRNYQRTYLKQIES